VILEATETPSEFAVTVSWPFFGRIKRTIRVKAADEAQALTAVTARILKTGPHFAIQPASSKRTSGSPRKERS
jgi:hypothetical protein